MKRIILLVFILSISSLLVFSQRMTGSRKTDPSGVWEFDAQYAPEGFTSGKVVVKNREDSCVVTMTFTGNDYPFEGERVKYWNDSLIFYMDIQGEYVKINLKVEDQATITGTAVYSEGVVPLSFKRDSSATGKM